MATAPPPSHRAPENAQPGSTDAWATAYGPVQRAWPTKAAFAVTLASLSLTLFSLVRVFRASLSRADPATAALQLVHWQRWRMIGQAGVITGLAAPIVVEGLGWDVPGACYLSERGSCSPFLRVLGLFGRREARIN